MANYVSKATGNWLTGGTWYNVETGTRGVQATHTASTNTTTSMVFNADAQDATGTTAKNCVGLLMFCDQVTATGTVTVCLSADSGVTESKTLAVNATDLPLQPSWVFFQFASVLALDGGTDYAIGVKGSSNGNAAFYRDGTAANWAHFIVWDDSPAGSPTTADNLYIAGVQTGAGAETATVVTMNETATTDYGTVDIGNIGTLSFDSGSAVNPYLKTSANMTIFGDGTLSIGTTGTPIPRDSVAVLEFDPTSDGEFGLIVNAGATFNAQGLSRTSAKDIISCKLNTDEAANQTTLGVDTDTGWLDNDIIGVASTTRTSTQCEKGTLNGNAGASTLTVDGFGGAGGGVLNAHSGTSPTQAEVILLTRNVRIRSATSTLMTYVWIQGTDSIVDIDWTEFRYLGENSGGKRGIQVDTTTGNFSIQYSSLYDFEDWGIYISGLSASNINISNNTLFNMNSSGGGSQYAIHYPSTANGSFTISNNIVMLVTGTNGITLFSFVNKVFTNNTVVGAASAGIQFVVTEDASTFSGNVSHSNGGDGFSFSGGCTGTISSCTSWRNTGAGLVITVSTSNATALSTYDGITAFGNTTRNIHLTGTNADTTNRILNNVVSNGDSTFSTTSGLGIAGVTLSPLIMKITNSNFSTASGILTAHTNDIIIDSAITESGVYLIDIYNTILAGTNEVTNQTSLRDQGWFKDKITSSKHDQTAGSHKTWFKYGTITTETTAGLYRTASPSARLTPNNASNKLVSGSFKVNVNSGQAATPTVYMRESVVGDGTDYNGNRPRLILRKNDAIGITADTVIGTGTVAAEGAFEALTGTTATATDDGVMEFVVDCDGTTGWVNVDDFSVTVA